MSFCVKGILFFFWEWVRELYDLFLHGSGRYVGSEDWVPLVLGPLDHYLHHHSSPTVACFDLSSLGWVVHHFHMLPCFLSRLFSLFSSVPLHHSSCPFSFFFYPRRSLFFFLNSVSSSIYNSLIDIVHLYVGWVTRLTQFSGIWHCALRGLVLSFGYLSLVSPSFHSPFTLTYITVWVVRPPWATRSRVHFDIFHLDRLHSLVEVRDVGQPPFHEDIKESHNAFSIRSPCSWATIRDRWCRELRLSRTPLLAALTCSYWGIPPTLAWWHQFLHVHIRFVSPEEVWHRCLGHTPHSA